MENLPRTLAPALLRVSSQFPVLMLTGPRQVGKTTLLEMCARLELPGSAAPSGAGKPAEAASRQAVFAPPRAYVTLDDLDARALARRDPALFLQTWPAPLIIDEVQYAPELLSAIKIAVDRERRNGMYWLTGSQKFDLMRGIGESLAGRVAVMDLLGLSQAEQDGRADRSAPFLPTPEWIASARANARPKSLQQVFEQIWLGSYPRLHLLGPSGRDVFYRSYVQTYLQRDVQDVLRVTDQTAFHRFLVAAAARTGQLYNYAGLARDADVDNKTAKAWLSVLETSGVVYRLQPYFRNRTQRIVKAPKLYFLDTGLAAYLTKWPDAAALEAGHMSGAMLETWAVAEVLKSYWHHGLEAPLHYYRDTHQQEVDLLIESADTLFPVEIKKTASPALQAARSFPAIAKLGMRVGPGAVLCFADRDLPLSREVAAIPLRYL